jgi:hypothetical protein
MPHIFQEFLMQSPERSSINADDFRIFLKMMRFFPLFCRKGWVFCTFLEKAPTLVYPKGL